MISLENFVVGAALASIASAASIPLAAPDVDCYTIWADGYSGNVPTYYETVIHRETSKFYSTSTPITTVTSIGATSTLTSSFTVTTFTGDGTSTVPASAGFTPLASVIASMQKPFAELAVEAQPTSAPERSSINSLSQLTECRYYDDCYPAEVNCIVHVNRAVTTTKVIRADETLTSTVVPTGVTTTTTITTTGTVTASVSPTATTYEVCQANNVIANYSATSGWVDAEYAGFLGLSEGTDGTDCCVKCLLMGVSCQASAYTETFLGGSCSYFLDSTVSFTAKDVPTCLGTNVAGIALYQENTATSNYTFSNSNCGQLKIDNYGG